MITVYYLVQEIAGPKNENGVSAPFEGGMGVAALSMLKAATQNSLNDVEFKLVLPGTQNVLNYFKIDHETFIHNTGQLVQVRMPVSDEVVYVAFHEGLKKIESYPKQARRANGYIYSEMISEVLSRIIKQNDIIQLNGWHFYTVASDIKSGSTKNPVILNIQVVRDSYRHIKNDKEINPWEKVIENSDILVPASKSYAQQITKGENEPLSEVLKEKISKKNIYGSI